jgi:hypothetical protein
VMIDGLVPLRASWMIHIRPDPQTERDQETAEEDAPFAEANRGHPFNITKRPSRPLRAQVQRRDAVFLRLNSLRFKAEYTPPLRARMPA